MFISSIFVITQANPDLISKHSVESEQRKHNERISLNSWSLSFKGNARGNEIESTQGTKKIKGTQFIEAAQGTEQIFTKLLYDMIKIFSANSSLVRVMGLEIMWLIFFLIILR